MMTPSAQLAETNNLQRELDKNLPLRHKLSLVHEALKHHCDLIHRVAVALYDPNTDHVSTFLYSSKEDTPLFNYSVKLSEVRSLWDIAQHGAPRIINNLTALAQRKSRHTQMVLAQGYQSSLTQPLYHNGSLLGFLFFNSYQKDIFTGRLPHLIDLFSQVIAAMVIKETSLARTIAAAIRTTQNITSHKDEETGAHLGRMSHYARLIATMLAKRHGFSDEYIEYILLFSPMHDIGKIAIPDSILSKPGKLTAAEFEVVKRHTAIGLEIINNMAKEFSFEDFPHIQMLRNIVEMHHETMDGSGYPNGVRGEQIPIEARICAVADIFDALTSQRCYKPAWSNEKAFSALREMARTKLDSECVEALIGNPEKIREIQADFAEVGGDDQPCAGAEEPAILNAA
ncbi:HD domain-containing phosphohydrolase [Herminiimonas sp. CN]|uniref:HD domain-containing phosphohydrolase n=1 Tax=Herminiimonas sp. CN TaxID=1349818 RepID=UPI000B1BC3C6|nr:HD domain-containing phosphohydrolase [Herminiimonas sp. CN]